VSELTQSFRLADARQRREATHRKGVDRRKRRPTLPTWFRC